MHRTPWTEPAKQVGALTLLILLLPLVAMQFTAEVNWGAGDFLAAGALLFTAGMAYALWARATRTRRQRVLAAVVVLAVLGTVWAELAVGLFD
jgi:hypothetical protein